MTWTKVSDDFAEECARAGLTDTEFRVHVEALIWCMRRETGGQLDRIDIRKGIEVPDPMPAVNTLVGIGWWTTTDNGWEVRQHMEDQVEIEVIAKRRQADAERQRKARFKKAGLPDVTA